MKKKTKIITIIGASVAGFLLLGAIGNAIGVKEEDVPESAATVQVAPPAPVKTPEAVKTETPKAEVVTPPAQPSPEILDLAFMSVMDSYFGPGIAAPARDLAKTFCRTLDSGISYGDAVVVSLSIAQDNGVSASDLGAIIGAGVPAYCPQYSDDAEAWRASLK